MTKNEPGHTVHLTWHVDPHSRHRPPESLEIPIESLRTHLAFVIAGTLKRHDVIRKLGGDGRDDQYFEVTDPGTGTTLVAGRPLERNGQPHGVLLARSPTELVDRDIPLDRIADGRYIGTPLGSAYVATITALDALGHVRPEPGATNDDEISRSAIGDGPSLRPRAPDERTPAMER